MRSILISFFLLSTLIFVSSYQPVFSRFSVRKSHQILSSTTEDPDTYNSYDPFDLDDSSFFSDLSNSSKRIKLQLDTAQFIQKFGPQQLLNIILQKVQNVNLPQESKGAVNDFLDFVEDLIYSNAANRIESKLKQDLTDSKPSQKLHIGEATISKTISEYGDTKDHMRRRDAPALAQNSVLISENENYPAVRQPLEPTKLAFLSHEPNFLREESVIRRSPSKHTKKRKLTRAQLEKAIKSAEREARELEMEKILKKRRIYLARVAKRRRDKEMEMKRRRSFKKLPISRIQEDNVRRSPVSGQVSFNEKMFQLLEEYGIRSFRVETADYTVRAFADPQKTRFSAINLLDVPEYNTAIRRKQPSPPFIYSRMVQAPKRQMMLRSQGKMLAKRRRLYLDRLL